MIKTAAFFWLYLSFLTQFLLGPLNVRAAGDSSGVELIVLGTLQDAGSPHIGCTRPCCELLSSENTDELRVVSLGIVDHKSRESFMIEATPDMAQQMRHLQKISGRRVPKAIAVTHAHIGHYTGLMYLGKEALNSSEVPVYCMPRMRKFLKNNGPWSQLVQDNNIQLTPLNNGKRMALNKRIHLTPWLVPHRDEYSETVGFKLEGPNKSVLFIPDIDKWNEWDMDIANVLADCDIAFIDGTFFSAEEIPHRNLNEIPHPTIKETMGLMQSLPAAEREKIHFIHFNHTNPLIIKSSVEQKIVGQLGYKMAYFNQRFGI